MSCIFNTNSATIGRQKHESIQIRHCVLGLPNILHRIELKILTNIFLIKKKNRD